MWHRAYSFLEITSPYFTAKCWWTLNICSSLVVSSSQVFEDGRTDDKIYTPKETAITKFPNGKYNLSYKKFLDRHASKLLKRILKDISKILCKRLFVRVLFLHAYWTHSKMKTHTTYLVLKNNTWKDNLCFSSTSCYLFMYVCFIYNSLSMNLFITVLRSFKIKHHFNPCLLSITLYNIHSSFTIFLWLYTTFQLNVLFPRILQVYLWNLICLTVAVDSLLST